MGIFLKGDISKAIGIGSVTIGEMEIDLSTATAEDIVSFQESTIKAAKGKKKEDLTTEDMLAIHKETTDWYVKFFMDKAPGISKDQIKKFVVMHKNELHKEFSIAFGIGTREEYEKREAQAKEDLLKKNF